MVYQLTYELRDNKKNYDPLYSYLSYELGEERDHILGNVWWFYSKSELDMNILCKKIGKLLSKKDVFYISPLPVKTDNNINGVLPNSCWVWYGEKIL